MRYYDSVTASDINPFYIAIENLDFFEHDFEFNFGHFFEDHLATLILLPRNISLPRAGSREVDLGGPSVHQGDPKFEIMHKSHCLKKNKLVDWEAKHVNWGVGPPGVGPESAQLDVRQAYIT